MNRWFAAALVAIFALGLAFRAPDLRLRPMHNDEGVNAMKFRGLYVNHRYKYDPNEFHGPTLPYFTLPAAWLGDAQPFNDSSEAMFRAVPVVFGLALIFVLLPLARELGPKQTLWAALFTALSPAMTFYSRDYIHEILLTFFTALAFVGAWRYWQTRKLVWAVVAGLAAGLMAATKETFVFSVFSMALAIVCVARPPFPPIKQYTRGTAVALLIALVVAVLFFTSFGANRDGVVDSVRAYLPWLHRAGGATPHTHPWYFYLQRLFFFHEGGPWIWSEAIIGLLAIFGAFIVRTPLGRVIRWYTLFLTIIYALLSYKTPWCLLTFYHGMIVLAGIGAVAALESCRQPWQKVAAVLVLVAGCVQLACQSWLANFGSYKGALLCADPINPYVYAQTSSDITRLTDLVDGLARVSPQKYETTVEVISPESYWPLPWYLRRFHKVGFWDKIPDQPLAPVMIVASSLDARFDERPDKTHLMAGYFKLRPDVFFELYVSIDLWTRYVKSTSSP
jgi:uncharacterized protein (TIGR03663 family)